MKSDVVKVYSRQDQTDDVMKQAELVAGYKNLSHKGTLYLRLLAEEMMSMMRAIAGDVAGSFWIEDKRGEYSLHLRVKTAMDFDKRDKLLAASKSGVNEANRGFMGKIRAFFEPLEEVPVFFDVSYDNNLTDMVWSMRSYETQLKASLDRDEAGAREAWDELEKSVIAHIADDVRVSIRGSEVEMVVVKNLE